MRTLMAIIAMLVFSSTLFFRDSHSEETADNKSSRVKVGVYETMDLWDHIKLGTAAYVNPQVLEDAAVGYFYTLNNDEWNEILNSGLYRYFESEEYTFGRRLESGEIEVPVFEVQNTSWSAGGLTIDMSSESAFNIAIKGWVAEQAEDGWALVGVLPELGDVSGEPIVAWDATQRPPARD